MIEMHIYMYENVIMKHIIIYNYYMLIKTIYKQSTPSNIQLKRKVTAEKVEKMKFGSETRKPHRRDKLG